MPLGFMCSAVFVVCDNDVGAASGYGDTPAPLPNLPSCCAQRRSCATACWTQWCCSIGSAVSRLARVQTQNQLALCAILHAPSNNMRDDQSLLSMQIASQLVDAFKVAPQGQPVEETGILLGKCKYVVFNRTNRRFG